MAKCQNCLNGISSAYIKDVIKGSFKKIGYYCNICNIHYNTDKKLYSVNEELYTVSKYYLFFRSTKKCHISIVNENILSIVKDMPKQESYYYSLRKQFERIGKSMNMYYCRKVFATYLRINSI